MERPIDPPETYRAEDARLEHRARNRLEDRIAADVSVLSSLENGFWVIVKLARKLCRAVTDNDDSDWAAWELDVLITQAERIYIERNIDQVVREIIAEGEEE